MLLQTLKTEVTELKERAGEVPRESAVVVSKGQPPPSSGSSTMDLSKMTTEELRAKLVTYQEFMAKYIVQAQQQKMKAVRAAELATATKYEEKIKFLLAGTTADGGTSTPVEAASKSSSTAETTKLYDTRSATVVAAAKAGKSRWGDKEVAKVKIVTPTPESNPAVEVKPDNLNGAAAKANGVAASAPAPISLPGSGVFEKRNQKIADAGKVGKSRWGDAEVKKATADVASKQPSLPPPPAEATGTPTPTPTPPAIQTTPEIEAADHGLRNDGGVGGPSLAERVNLGRQLLDSSASSAPIAQAQQQQQVTTTSPIAHTYDLRNARIAAAAAAGKSRWGSMENAKATASNALKALPISNNNVVLVANTNKPKAAIVESSPEIEAADHGLRNDGGVGGPSLAERVNLGSGLLKE